MTPIETLNPFATSTSLPVDILALLRDIPVLATLGDRLEECLLGATQLHIETGQTVIVEGDEVHNYYILLRGSLRLTQHKSKHASEEDFLYTMKTGEAFGEVPLIANAPSPVTFRSVEPCDLVVLNEDHFWRLLSDCPGVRKAILGTMARRLTQRQSESFHQEKMVALGTLAAGLMHELNNPGAAARRASVQLREKLERMHHLTANWARTPLNAAQKECMYELQEHALAAKPRVLLDSIAQADAEDALAAWMQKAGVEDAWKLAPTLIAVGMDAPELECAHESLPAPAFSMALHWLEALVSSMQLVGTIEESIGRVTDLVHAVKSYAYESRGQHQSIDVNHSIYATLIILAHKLREKEIVLEKNLDPALPKLETGCQGVNQVWTNLLDNAIDAVPQGGRIRIKTWSEPAMSTPGNPANTNIFVLIGDNGSGIPLACQAKIFDPFFTTKPVGVGTGLGLGIVYRAVEGCGGTVRFSSTPGETEFLVRLPATLPTS